MRTSLALRKRATITGPKKWAATAGLIALALAGCATQSDEKASDPAPTAEVSASDDGGAGECEVPAEYLSEIEAAEDPSSPELDDVRTEIFEAMECLDDEVETVELADLSTLMYVPDGGFTWYPESKELATRGFAVSQKGTGQLVENIRDLSPNEVEEILTEYVEEHQGGEGWVEGKSAIGAWQNPDTGDVALDISRVEDDASVARTIGEENDQKAIFDLQVLTSVWVGGVTP